jgi:uncharacterized protein YbaR (Trm112 family)
VTALDPFLLEVTACPQCKGSLHVGDTLDCTACGLSYPIVDGIPVLLISDAQPLKPEADAR